MDGIVISTRNPSKETQIRPFLEGLPLRVMNLDEAGITGEAVEDGTTSEENAEKKAIFAWRRTAEPWCIAEDTEFRIDALDGRPGIYAARWAGEGKTTEEVMQYTLDQLAHVPEGRRTGTFRTAVVLINPCGFAKTFVGEVSGVMLTAPRVPCQPKMPYSGLFIPDGQSKVWAEMTTEEENAISHRGKAFRQARTFLEGVLK
jgi:XTP/dITP diphosphohydrolase